MHGENGEALDTEGLTEAFGTRGLQHVGNLMLPAAPTSQRIYAFLPEPVTIRLPILRQLHWESKRNLSQTCRLSVCRSDVLRTEVGIVYLQCASIILFMPRPHEF